MHITNTERSTFPFCVLTCDIKKNIKLRRNMHNDEQISELIVWGTFCAERPTHNVGIIERIA